MFYNINKHKDVIFLTFKSLEKYSDIIHCFTSRMGGVSEGCYESLNLGFDIGDAECNVQKNYEILASSLNIDIDCFTTTSQTHTSNIMVVEKSDRGKGLTKIKDYDNVDGLITNIENIALITKHADCTPVLFYDPIKKVIGAAHAGWKGTLQDISGKMIDMFRNIYGSDSKNIIACIGPSLCQDCFEVDLDVASMFLDTNEEYRQCMFFRNNKAYIDLWEINKFQLLDKGLKKENVSCMELCTKCNNNLFFSHRGQKGKRGLMVSLIMLKECNNIKYI